MCFFAFIFAFTLGYNSWHLGERDPVLSQTKWEKSNKFLFIFVTEKNVDLFNDMSRRKSQFMQNPSPLYKVWAQSRTEKEELLSEKLFASYLNTCNSQFECYWEGEAQGWPIFSIHQHP